MFSLYNFQFPQIPILLHISQRNLWFFHLTSTNADFCIIRSTFGDRSPIKLNCKHNPIQTVNEIYSKFVFQSALRTESRRGLNFERSFSAWHSTFSPLRHLIPLTDFSCRALFRYHDILALCEARNLKRNCCCVAGGRSSYGMTSTETCLTLHSPQDRDGFNKPPPVLVNVLTVGLWRLCDISFSIPCAD